ncbi:MAG TPA: 3-phenylpropionate/cinnamic acid dioxygenase subunit beta [Candidatus Binatia bacterium]|jgi:3-phenylpropionate/trans-cinnamate dioxygenase beta subunit
MDFAHVQQEIERFLYHEARLLDSLRFRDWLALFTDDARYRMPTIENVQNLERAYESDDLHFGYFNDDKQGLALRVSQLDTGLRHAEVPPSLTERLITNILVEPSEASDEVNAYSNFLVFQVRHGRHETSFTGRREDRLRRTDQGWKIAAREIIMLRPVLPRTLSIFF